mmetsp:Transcript_55708/g.129735  ORF Transcript_55708/g.129735 Transcript_55708/m.129735 type:complete len:265 (-) Transcript_55708:31-825(-)
MALRLCAVVFISSSSLLFAEASEIISDIMVPAMDQSRALEIKKEQFWRPLMRAAERRHHHEPLYAKAEAVISGLPNENAHVQTLLEEALASLRRADAAVLSQAKVHERLASEKLVAPASGGSTFSFFQGQNFLAQALQRFTDFGGYFASLRGDVRERQTSVLPALQGAAASAGDVLSDCRSASKHSFDALKYDIYEKGVPKTPPGAKEIANQIIDGAGETRRQFMQMVTAVAEGITRDVQSQRDDPSATVTRAVLGSSDGVVEV